jgi:hypothetical protein
MKRDWKDLVPKGARRELVSHSLDKRTEECFPRDLDEARTKDDLWNTIQRGLRRTGCVAPRLLPYYVRRVVECTPSDPMGALLTAMRLLQVRLISIIIYTINLFTDGSPSYGNAPFPGKCYSPRVPVLHNSKTLGLRLFDVLHTNRLIYITLRL